jgi:hypothetical protein
VIDRGSVRAVVSIAPTPAAELPSEVAEEDAPQNSMRGIITVAADKLREIRDGEDETPAEGVATSPAKGQKKAKGQPTEDSDDELPPKKQRRRPGWVAVIVAMLAGGPTYTELREIFKDAFGVDEAVAEAKEIGALDGRITEQAKQIAELRGKIASNTAGDIEGAYHRALEFRHFDSQLEALGSNISRLMDSLSIPLSERSSLTKTPPEISERHDRDIKLYRDALTKAERDAIKRAVAEGDTVTGP